MTPSEELRAAAAVLRRMATKATAGPWLHHDTWLDQGGHTASVFRREGDSFDLVAWLPTFEQEPWGEKRNVWANSQWIALMNPKTAEGFALLLEREASALEWADDWTGVYKGALPIRDMADAINGGAE